MISRTRRHVYAGLFALPIVLGILWHLYSVRTGGPAYTEEMYMAIFLAMAGGLSLAFGMYEWEEGRLRTRVLPTVLLSPLGFLFMVGAVLRPAGDAWSTPLLVLGGACVIVGSSLRARARNAHEQAQAE